MEEDNFTRFSYSIGGASKRKTQLCSPESQKKTFQVSLAMAAAPDIELCRLVHVRQEILKYTLK